ncbi:MAG: glutamate--tRNA ligase [Microgenomates group bacterium]
MSTRTRFAPSPTGFLHIGGLRTALYAYALAKHDKGDFILRIEDTDQKREVEGAVDALKKTLEKFGIIWDEFYVQSERQKEGIYLKAAEKLVKDGHAFYCQCKAKNAKEEGFSSSLRDPCRDKELTSGAIKLKVPEARTLTYRDFVHKKEISWKSDDVYDATLLKTDGFPTYHLAVAVDDIDMKVSHILRGHDWLPSTPIHLLVFKYLGGVLPEIGHLTDILSGETGKKLSKRRDSVFAEQFIDEGYLPEALLNFVMLLGWAPKDNQELFTLEEFVKKFDINGFQEANPRFFRDKLDWFNGYYIRQKSDEELMKLFKPYMLGDSEDLLKKIVPLVKDRIKKLTDLKTFTGFFFEEPKIDEKLLGKNFREHLSSVVEVIEGVGDWSLESLNTKLMDMVKEKSFKTGDLFMDVRIAVTGTKFTPPINDSIIILGKEETLKRIKKVL